MVNGTLGGSLWKNVSNHIASVVGLGSAFGTLIVSQWGHHSGFPLHLLASSPCKLHGLTSDKISTTGLLITFSDLLPYWAASGSGMLAWPESDQVLFLHTCQSVWTLRCTLVSSPSAERTLYQVGNLFCSVVAIGMIVHSAHLLPCPCSALLRPGRAAGRGHFCTCCRPVLV